MFVFVRTLESSLCQAYVHEGHSQGLNHTADLCSTSCKAKHRKRPGRWGGRRALSHWAKMATESPASSLIFQVETKMSRPRNLNGWQFCLDLDPRHNSSGPKHRGKTVRFWLVYIRFGIQTGPGLGLPWSPADHPPGLRDESNRVNPSAAMKSWKYDMDTSKEMWPGWDGRATKK